MMNNNQAIRYSRHILLNEMGVEGQEKISASHALIIGAGGLGSPVSYYLASGGIGTITLVDNDVVELTNLQRQILHVTERIGQNKALSGKETLHHINPEVNVIPVTDRVDDARLNKLVKGVDVVLDCTDNFATRHAINRACVANRVALVSGATVRFDGQVSVYDTRLEDCPCYSCLYPENQHFEDIKAAQVGVFAPIVGIIGTTQAAEALKLVAHIGQPLCGSLLLLDGLTMDWTRILMDRNPDCPVCANRPKD